MLQQIHKRTQYFFSTAGLNAKLYYFVTYKIGGKCRLVGNGNEQGQFSAKYKLFSIPPQRKNNGPDV